MSTAVVVPLLCPIFISKTDEPFLFLKFPDFLVFETSDVRAFLFISLIFWCECWDNQTFWFFVYVTVLDC